MFHFHSTSSISLSLLPVSNAKFAFFSQVCVAAIAQTECILALKKCMENERDLVAMCCETLTRLFKCQHVSGLFFKRFWRLRHSHYTAVQPKQCEMFHQAIFHQKIENVLYDLRKFGLWCDDEWIHSYRFHLSHFQFLHHVASSSHTRARALYGFSPESNAHCSDAAADSSENGKSRAKRMKKIKLTF